MCRYDGVSLSPQEVYYQYWPSSGTQAYGEFTVENLDEAKFEGFSLRSFGVFDGKVSPSHSVMSSELETLSTPS